MRTKTFKTSFLAIASLTTLWGLSAARSWAGPAKYDPETRSIRLTYTYASLTEGLFGEAAIGAPQKPSSDQDAKVRTVVLKVSDALSKATAGRMKVASLDLVPDVKQADVVISLTGKPARGGWAIAGAIEGRPGQIGLYFQTLAEEWEQDYVLTATHEICHYIFAFVDEYNFPNGCPRANPGGPGCLMDNYLSQGTRHGWYGRFCSAADHFADPSQRRSCQEIADAFFQARGVTAEGPADNPAAAANVANGTKSVVDNIKMAAIGKVQEEVESRIKDRKGVGSASLNVLKDSKLKDVARKFLDSQLKLNKVNLASGEVNDLANEVLKQTASLVRVAIPPRFDPLVDLIAKFAGNRARELRDSHPKDGEVSRRRKIYESLLTFVAGLSGTANAPTVDGPVTPEEKRFLEHLAMQADLLVDAKKANDDLYEAAMAHIKLDRETASTVLDIAGEVGVVGMASRLAALGEVDTNLGRYLPGRTASTGFGRRRTIVIDPDPLDPQKDFVVTQSGIYRYADLRDQYVELFQKLVERAKVELLTTDQQNRRLEERRKMLAKPAGQRLREDRIRRIAELTDRNKVRSQREAELRASINDLVGQVRRNRLENIVFLIPPGGLPGDMSALFELLRRQIIVQRDVRLDLVLVNSADVPFELRDIAIGSGGSIVTIADIDEVGAVAQRLKNEQTSGAWVILPHQDEIGGRRADDEQTKWDQWLLLDAKMGQFKNEPSRPYYVEAKKRLEEIAADFRRKKDGAAPKPKAGNADQEPDPEKSLAERDLLKANIMSPDAIDALAVYANEILNGADGRKQPRDHAENRGGAADDDDPGFVKEFEKLFEVIERYNRRNPGAGEEMKFAILEHVIRARGRYQELQSLLDLALTSHEGFLSPDFDEDKVVDDSYKEAYAGPQAKKGGERVDGENPREGAEKVGAQKARPDDPEKKGRLNKKWKARENLIENFQRLSPRWLEKGLAAQEKDRFNEATNAYINLKIQSFRLREVHDFLDHVEQEIARTDQTPLFRRIDRDSLKLANQRIQDADPGFLPRVPGAIRHRPLPPVDAFKIINGKEEPNPDAFRLPRFYAENLRFDPSKPVQAEFELIVGLSQPLPGLDAAALRDNKTDVMPELRLYDDNGQLVNTPTLRLDRDMSNPTCLIYHFSPEFGETGWYTGLLLLKRSKYRLQESINFTFSVASTRPNFRLNAALVQMPNDPELIPPPPNRGLARAMDRRAKVEVQVYGGTSVLGASIRGVLHKLDDGSNSINPIAQNFYDDGKTFGDLKPDDGVYTTIIPLDQIEKGVEYRVLIQAQSTDVSRNIAPEDPGKFDEKRRQDAIAQGAKDVRKESVEKVDTPEPQPAVNFQRATSIQIRVER